MEEKTFTESLKELGLSDEQTQGAFALFGKTLNPTKEGLTAALEENERLKADLEKLQSNAAQASEAAKETEDEGQENVPKKAASPADDSLEKLAAQKKAIEDQLLLEKWKAAGAIDPEYLRDKFRDKISVTDSGDIKGFDEALKLAEEKHASLLNSSKPVPKFVAIDGDKVNAGPKLTREAIMQVKDRKERLKLIRENEDLF